MAKKAANGSTATAAAPPPAPVSTPVRNSAIPKASPPVASAGKREVTRDQIAIRAYEIYRSGTGGSPEENWHRAERELRGL